MFDQDEIAACFGSVVDHVGDGKTRIGYVIYTMHLRNGDNRQITEWQGTEAYDKAMAVFHQHVASYNRNDLPVFIPALQTTLEVVDHIIPFERMIDIGGWAK